MTNAKSQSFNYHCSKNENSIPNMGEIISLDE
jgi:hypothetical protein